MKISLSDFEIPKSGKFYKLANRLSKKTVTECFIELSKEKKGYFLNFEIRVPMTSPNNKKVSISSACFKIESEVTFIKNKQVTEIKHAFIILIEFDNYLAVFQKNSQDPYTFLKKNLELFTSSELTSYIDEKNNPCCEKISVNGMSVGKYDILRKSYEAHNLIDSLPTFNSNRLIPRAAKFSENENNYSISINTNRITEYSSKTSIDNIIDWCFNFKSRIEENPLSQFMEQFSSSIDLKKLPNDVIPTGVLVNVSRVIESIGDNHEIHYKSKKISERRINKIIKNGRQLLDVKKSDSKIFTLIDNLLFLEKNEKSFTIKSDKLSDYSIYDNNTGKKKSIISFLNLKGFFDVTFSDLSYFYTNKRLYKDSHMIQNVKFITSIYEGVESFNNALTEKGEKFISRNSVKFPTHSLFSHVESYYKDKSDIIICDDLGSQEWADHFIFKKVKSGTPSVILVHSKAKSKTSHGASEMQEVVGQAIKNLGKVILTDATLEIKRKLWSTGYSPSIKTAKGQTKPPSFHSNISRISYLPNTKFSHIKKHIIDIMSSPKCHREVVLALNFVQKSQINLLIEKAEKNNLASHESQLLWLMSSFVSSCIEVGVRPKVLCRP